MICDLYVITSEEFSRGRTTLEVVEQALKGGTRVIQLREKTFSTRKLVEVGRGIRELTQKYNSTFIVNDRIDVALAVGADGVHLGQDDMGILEARKILGRDKVIGISADNLEEALEAQKQGANYIGLGPIFPTGSKDDAASPIGLKSLQAIAKEISIPIVAIGGINYSNASEVIKAGAEAISVISAVISAPDVLEATHSLNNLILNVKKGMPK